MTSIIMIFGCLLVSFVYSNLAFANELSKNMIAKNKSENKTTTNPKSISNLTSLYPIWKSYRNKQYANPSSMELLNSKKLFKNVLQRLVLNKNFNSCSQYFIENDSQFEVFEQNVNGEAFVFVADKKNTLSGNGLYIFRKNGNGIMLQAPHAFKDLNTGRIGLKLMLEGRFSALALNTAPRNYYQKGIQIDADLAHLSTSTFMQASVAFAEFYPEGQIVQLHGYNTQGRAETFNTDMILSDGSKSTQSQVMRQQACLIKNLTHSVFVYPKDINVLGGTTNTIGSAVRNIGYSGFRHYEMSLPLRKRLVKSRHVRDSLTQCLQ